MAEADRTMRLTEEAEQIPIADVVTGRGFITGKSGSGKSNTASVLCEELLDRGIPLLIVDTDGEYYGLKEDYELLHVGGDERCDLRIGPQHAAKIADITLENNVPIILDVSGFVEESDSKRLVHDIVRELFVKEKRINKPYLLLVEEAHEFIPESGGLDDVGEMLVRVAKRGRKRGLGLCAMSQRPASVSKDIITQCDWIVWHRLTWKNDTQVVSRIMGSATAEEVTNLEPGEAVMLADWNDEPVRVKFRRKRTLDAGATPDLDGVVESHSQSVRSDIVDELEEAGASLTESGEERSWDDEAEPDQPAQAADEGEDGPAQGDATPPEEHASPAEQPTGAADDDGETPEPDPLADPADGRAIDADDTEEQTPAAERTPGGGESETTATAVEPTDWSADPAESTEDVLERVASSIDGSGSVEPASRPRSVGSADADRGGRSRRRPTPDPDPAEDPVWEVAEFVAYLVGSLGALAMGLAASVRRALARVAGASGGQRGPAHPRRPAVDSPAVGLLVAAVLVVVGLLVGYAVATLL